MNLSLIFFRNLLLAFLLSVSFFGFSSVFAKNKLDKSNEKKSTTIGVIDMQFVLDNSVASQKLNTSLNSLNNTIQQDMLEKERILKNMEKVLIERKNLLSEELYNNELKLFNEKVSEVQMASRVAKSKLETTYSEGMQKINKDIQTIVKSISKSRNIDIVIPSSSVLYFKEDLVITNSVLKQLNAISTD